MKIVSVESDLKNQLFLDIDRNLTGLRKRNVAYVLNTFSGDLATILLFVSGKKGTTQKTIIIKKENNIWFAYEQNVKYELTSINEIVSVCKIIVSRLYTIVSKF